MFSNELSPKSLSITGGLLFLMYSQYLKTFKAVIFFILLNSISWEFYSGSSYRSLIYFDSKAISSYTSNVS